MTIKNLLAGLLSDQESSSVRSKGADRSKHSGGKKGKGKQGDKVMEAIKEAAKKATDKAIKRRKAAEKEYAKWRKAAEKKYALSAAAEEDAGEKEPVRIAPEEEELAVSAAEEAETVSAAGEEEAGTVPEEEEAADEKAARKAAKKQKAAEEAAQWAAESVRALGESVEADGGDAVTALRKLCDTLDWKCLKNLTGCQIEYSLDENFSDSKKEKIRKFYKLSEPVKKLEPGKQYYVRVRLCSAPKDKKHYSDWSEVMILKT